MAATLWRLQGVQTIGGGDLELGELRLWGESATLDMGAQLRASHAPVSGTLESLRDGSGATTCRWSASDVASPGFYVEWETTAPVDAWCVRFSSPQPELHIGAYRLAMLQNGTWLVADNGWVPYTSGLSPARVNKPAYGIPIGWSQADGPLAGLSGFREVAVSADGQTIVVIGVGSSAAKVSVSRDGGRTWSQPTGPLVGTSGFIGAAVSADGQTIVVAGLGSSAATVSISKNGGLTWSQPTGPLAGTSGFAGAAVSADGQTVVVAGIGSSDAKVSISRDAGLTWSQPTGPLAASSGFAGVAVSANGQKVVAVGNGVSSAAVSISSDGGLTWSQRAGPLAGSSGFSGSAVSADGQTVVVTGNGSTTAKVSISLDGGTTWTQPGGPIAGSAGFRQCAVSADGETLVVSAFGAPDSKVNISRDGGLSWSQPVGPMAGTSGFFGAAVSEDGQTVVVTAIGSSDAKVSLSVLPDQTYVEKPIAMQSELAEVAFAGAAQPPQGHIGIAYQTASGFDLEFGGDGTVYGTVAIKADPMNTLVARRVRLRRSRDGLHVRETWSNAQGEYRFEGVNRQYEYDVEAWDHTGNMRSVLANNVTPEKMV